jgi:hypothetical protein
VSLALSLHAPTQELRQQIVPSARAYKLDKLMAAVDDYMARSGQKVRDGPRRGAAGMPGGWAAGAGAGSGLLQRLWQLGAAPAVQASRGPTPPPPPR